jgi:LPS sulfotransferase NodH
VNAVEPPFLTPEGVPRAFIIVSSARSGSNLLVGYLRQVSQAACLGEILRSDFVGKPGWDRLVQRLDLPAEAASLHDRDLTGFWELVLARGLRRRRWLGAKAFYYHRRDDPVWERFGEADHRIIHLWRDATFDQYVSRLLAVTSGEWKSPSAERDGREVIAAGTDEGAGADEGATPRVTFDRAGYLEYREALRADIQAARARYGGSGRYVEIEYRQLLDHDVIEGLLADLFGERIDVAESLRRQRSRPKIEYLANPADGAPFTADSIERGFAAP